MKEPVRLFPLPESVSENEMVTMAVSRVNEEHGSETEGLAGDLSLKYFTIYHVYVE